MLLNWFPTSMLHTQRSLAHSQVSTDFPVVSLVSHFSWFTLFMTFYKSLPFHFLSTAKSYLHPPLPAPWQLPCPFPARRFPAPLTKALPTSQPALPPLHPFSAS